jgi:hypothetical protein
MALTNATTLADYGSGIGTQGATLKVDANNQRVGIGTLTPAETLDVVGNMAVDGDISVTGTISYEDVTNVDSVGLSTFRAGINVTGGSVGIGTDNPSNKFHATQYTANTDVATFQIGSASAYTGFVNCRVGTTGSGSFIGGLYTPDGSLEGLQGTNGLIFSTGGSNLERLRITSSGSVGIGTDSPKHKLNVYNETAGSAGGILVQNVTYTTNEDRPYLIVGTKDWTGATTNWNTYGFQHRIKSNSGGSPRITIDTFNGEAFCVDNSGDVGIGTDNPTKILHLSQNSDIAIRMHAGNANVNARSWEITVGGNPSNNTEMVFRTREDDGTGGSECARITRSGVIKLPSGGGIDFSATSDAGGMTSELLDDYEEGTWTPQLNFNGGTTGITYAALNGAYIKIGRMVMVRGGFALTNKGSSSGSAYVGGLPFTVESLSYADATAIGGAAALSSINGPPVVVAQNTQTKALLWYNTTSGARILISEANFNNNTELYFSLVYTVS